MQDKNELHILWTSADPTTAHLMVLMYATNGLLRGFWQAITVIIWGGAVKLVNEDESVRERILMARHAGVRFTACVACARELGAVEALEGLGVEVKPWGAPLTELIKEGKPLLTV